MQFVKRRETFVHQRPLNVGELIASWMWLQSFEAVWHVTATSFSWDVRRVPRL